MDARISPPHHAPVRVLTHIKKLDDCFGQFLVRVICNCGACREIEPEALARLVGWKVTLKDLALRMRCSRCGKQAAEVVAVALCRRALYMICLDDAQRPADDRALRESRVASPIGLDRAGVLLWCCNHGVGHAVAVETLRNNPP